MKHPPLLVISPYPKKGTLYNNTHGIVSFAKNTVNAIHPYMKKSGRSMVVIANQVGKSESYMENGVKVERCFEKNKFSMYINIFKRLLNYKNSKDLLIEFDFSLYGDFYVVSLFPIFLLFLRLFGYRINLVLHAVILDLKKIAPHLGYGNDLLSKLKTNFYTLCIKVFYFLFSITTSKIFVLENTFVNDLKKINPKANVFSIHHGVDSQHNKITNAQARGKLGIKNNEFTVTSFGYVAWYKGSDFLVNNFSKRLNLSNKNIKFLLAGGQAPAISSKQYYKNYYEKISQKLKGSKNIKLTGFINEEDIATYYVASDLMIFPYRAFMASSGPLSFALTYKKPFILSNNFKDIKKDKIFSDLMSKAGLKESDIFFDLTKKEVVLSIKNILETKKIIKLKKFSELLSQQYSWNKIGKTWFENINNYDRLTDYSTYKLLLNSNQLLTKYKYT